MKNQMENDYESIDDKNTKLKQISDKDTYKNCSYKPCHVIDF